MLIPVCTAQLSTTLSYFTSPYILGNKKKEKKLITFLYISVIVFSCYTTQ